MYFLSGVGPKEPYRWPERPPSPQSQIFNKRAQWITHNLSCIAHNNIMHNTQSHILHILTEISTHYLRYCTQEHNSAHTISDITHINTMW